MAFYDRSSEGRAREGCTHRTQGVLNLGGKGKGYGQLGADVFALRRCRRFWVSL